MTDAMRLAPPRSILLLVTLAALLVPAATAHAVVPSATAVPAISGTARSGQTLTTTNGTWTGTAPIGYTRRWERCDVDGVSNCTTILGASGSTYTLTDAEVGGTVRVIVTATNVDGSASSTSAASPVVAPKSPPVNAVLPAITGLARDAQALSVDNGTWTGVTPIAYTRRWQRCDADGVNCVPLTATSPAYTLTSADVGSTIRVSTTASNTDGSTTVLSAPTAVVDAVAPANSSPPTITGTVREGQTLTNAVVGSWTGTTPITYTRQWERCDSSGANCSLIPAATNLTYTLQAADVGGTIRVVVTGTNQKGSATGTSVVTAVIAPKAPPTATVAPAISGSNVDGGTLVVSAGTWTGTPTISYTRRWYKCDSAGASCAATTSAGTTLVLTAADVGSTFRVETTATNPDGSTVLTTPQTAVIQPALPSATVIPAVSGTTREGQVLSGTTGTWKGTPVITYAYQWNRCSGSTCTTIDGATQTSYRLQPEDVGMTIRLAVTATNAGGDTSSWSNPTATITAGAPVNLVLPDITAPLVRDGQVYSSNLGTWAGTAPLTYNRQWVRCGTNGMQCSPISGAVDPTYQLTSADVGRTVRLELTAANGQGTTKVQSLPSATVAAAPPSADNGITVSGNAVDGQPLAAVGTWSGTAPITLTYQWERCDAVTLTCVSIAGATSASYALTSLDVGSRVRVRVGATNVAGGGAATSDPTAIIGVTPPTAPGSLTITGAAVEGQTLAPDTSGFGGTRPLAFTYQWQHCDSGGNSCAAVAGATGATRVLSGADRGFTMRVVVTATNSSGTVTKTSAATGVVKEALPVNTILPSVSPNTGLKDGRVLTVTDGAWTGSTPMTFAYQWLRCETSGSQCIAIPGATESTFRLTTDQVGFTVRATVTAVNGAGATAATSLATGTVLTNPPANTVAPSILGDTKDGSELRALDGEWIGLVPFVTAYQWWRCDAAGENCGAIDGQTSSTYQLAPEDVGLTLRIQVFQTNIGGTSSVTSAPTDPIRAGAPVNLTPPEITGPVAVTKLITATRGTWAGTPDLYATYQWLRCDTAGDNCIDIPDATQVSYRLTMDDDGWTVRVRVTMENAVGSVAVLSAQTPIVSDDPPTVGAPPEITAGGLIADTTLLTASSGTWTGAMPIDYAYRWQRCDQLMLSCTDISGANYPAYRLTKDDVGKRVVVKVTATNAVDVRVATSEPTPAVLPEPPSVVAQPTVTVTGAVRDGSKLTALQGTWKGAQPIQLSTTWVRCDTAGANCAVIPDATTTSYTLSSADVGKRVRARVTARNSATTIFADSEPTAVVAPLAPSSSARTTIAMLDGAAKVGARLKSVPPAFSGSTPMQVTTQWQRCVGSTTSACVDVPGANGQEYRLTEGDVGKRVRVLVTAANVGGTVTSDSTPTTAVPAVTPESTALPVVTGGPARDGATLQASLGSWTGSAPIAYTYQWERCTQPGATSCTRITGASRDKYTLTTTDVGKFIRISVTAANAGGKATAVSATTEAIDAAAPVSTAPPTVSAKGTLRAGVTMLSTPGKWSGSTPLKYETRWQSCDEKGLKCEDIPDAEKSSYVLKPEDVSNGKLKVPLRVIVRASNIAGATEAPSAAFGAPEPPKPGTAKPKTSTKTRYAARISKARISAAGLLNISFSCSKKSKGACGVIGSFRGGKLRHGVNVARVKKGKTLVFPIVLDEAEKRSLKGKSRLVLVFRVAAPAAPTYARVVRVGLPIPKAFGGVVKATAKKKTSSSAKKTTSSTKKKTSTKKKATSKKKKRTSKKKKRSTKKRTSSTTRRR